MRTVILALTLLSQSTACLGFESGRAAFTVRVNDLEIPYSVFAVYVLPSERLEIAVVDASARSTSELVADDGELVVSGTGLWTWRSPNSAGAAELRVRAGGDEIRLNVLVMHPASSVRNERINGFRIGRYEAEPLNGNPLYLPADGFVELTQANADLLLSPHFRLSQFPSKQAGRFPKYLVLREQLLLKLELLLEHVNASGVAADSFTIMSGYRTPFYNAAIGNVPYSRHVFGGAADIYIDVAPVDNYMDDLNQDGARDYRDAQWLYALANELFGRQQFAALRGGLGVYRRTSAHGPFLHIDARAQRARWGLLP